MAAPFILGGLLTALMLPLALRLIKPSQEEAEPAASGLRSMAGRLLDDSSFRLQADALSAGLKSAGGAKTAADKIEAITT